MMNKKQHVGNKESVKKQNKCQSMESCDGQKQWYEINPELQESEIKSMESFPYNKKMGYLPNGQMYWTVNFCPIVCGQRKDWTLLAVYDSNYSKTRTSCLVKIYPVKPSYEEMKRMVEASSITPKVVPHVLTDMYGQVFLSALYRHDPPREITCVLCLYDAMRWVIAFELGLVDQKTWTIFQENRLI